jgi:hypothetical protein
MHQKRYHLYEWGLRRPWWFRGPQVVISHTRSDCVSNGSEDNIVKSIEMFNRMFSKELATSDIIRAAEDYIKQWQKTQVVAFSSICIVRTSPSLCFFQTDKKLCNSSFFGSLPLRLLFLVRMTSNEFSLNLNSNFVVSILIKLDASSQYSEISNKSSENLRHIYTALSRHTYNSFIGK